MRERIYEFSSRQWIQVLGLLLLTALAALSVFAPSVVLFHTEISWFKRLLCLLLAAAILWYYIWVLKNFVDAQKGNNVHNTRTLT